jgi:hypothetical protein
MDPLQSLIALQADVERIAEERARQRWVIGPLPLTSVTFFVTMTSDIDGEAYVIRLACEDYPDQPPSIKCVNKDTKDPGDPKAWPRCDGFRPTSDLCLSVSREGLKQLHPDWDKDPRYRWESTGNPIWYVLSSLQDRLNDHGKYHGRNQ